MPASIFAALALAFITLSNPDLGAPPPACCDAPSVAPTAALTYSCETATTQSPRSVGTPSRWHLRRRSARSHSWSRSECSNTASSMSASAACPWDVSRLCETRSAAAPWPPRRSPLVIAPRVSSLRATDDANRCSPPTSVTRST